MNDVHNPNSAYGTTGADHPSLLRTSGFIVLAVLFYLLLIDAAIETFLSHSPLRWIIGATITGFIALNVFLWRKLSWSLKASLSLFVLFGLMALAAWRPRGSDSPITLLQQPTSTVLSYATIFAILLASWILARVKFLPWPARASLVVLALYGVAAFALGISSRTPYAALLRGASFWKKLPFWLHGSWIGVAVILLAILSTGIAAIRSRSDALSPKWLWQLNAPLAPVFLMAVSVAVGNTGMVSPPAKGRPGENGWSATGSRAGGSGAEEASKGPFPGTTIGTQLPSAEVESTDSDIALDANGGAIESISGTVDPDTRFYGPGFNGRRLIDGKAEPTWSGDPAGDPGWPNHPRVLPTIPLEIVLSFYRHQSALVGAVVISPGKQLAKAPKDVEIWVSESSPVSGFRKVGGGALPPDAGDHQITFPAVEARYLKVRVLSNQNPEVGAETGKPILEIAEIRVLEARQAGYVSIRDRSHDLPNWKGSPRYAAQRGIEWMQPASIVWQKDKACFGCHMQAQVVMGLAVAKKNEYIVDDQAAKDLTEFTVAKQSPDGSYERDNEGSTAFAGMGLAHWDDLAGIKRNPALIKVADFLLTKQDASGELPYVRYVKFPSALSVLQGSLMPTANSLTTFKRAYDETNDSRYKDAADRALAWIATAPTATTQDKVFKILALSRFGSGQYAGVIQQIVEQLITEQTPSGGWLVGQPGLTEPSPFSTGEVLYAFKQASVSIRSSPFIKGVKYLLATQQQDGWWKADQKAMYTQGAGYVPTMWAVIGLAGAFGDGKTGSLQVVAETDSAKAASHNLEIILDCSGSMRSRLGKGTRITTAREVLRQVLAKLPDDLNVGLRLYAHRYSWKDMQHSCTDTELVVPIDKLERQRILTTVDKVQPRGDTPLVYSVLQTPADLKTVGGGSVIVITDGQETCHGDPAKAAAELKASGIPVTLNIIGFTLAGQEKADVERLMRPFAEATGGHYYYAENGEALAKALSQAALNKFTYEVFDASGQQVAKGQAGPFSQELRPGTYRVVVHAGDQQLSDSVTVQVNSDIVLHLVRKAQQFVLEQGRSQAEPPVKQTASGQEAQ